MSLGLNSHIPYTKCRRPSTPLIPYTRVTYFRADECMDEQARKYLQRMGRVLAGKWAKSYSEVMGFIMGRVTVASQWQGRSACAFVHHAIFSTGTSGSCKMAPHSP